MIIREFHYQSSLKVCSMKLKLDQFDQETVEMIPDIIDLQSSTELTQYFIKTWSLTYTNQRNSNGEHSKIKINDYFR